MNIRTKKYRKKVKNDEIKGYKSVYLFTNIFNVFYSEIKEKNLKKIHFLKQIII